jgi:hypothetical protein
MGSDLTKTCVDIESPLIARFREIYPQHGSVKWFFNEAFRAFLEIHDPEKVREEIKTAVEEAISYNEEDV